MESQSIHPDLDWAASGAMALSGHTGGPPLLAPAAVTAVARTALSDLLARAAADPLLDARLLAGLDAAALLGERAAVFGHTQRLGTTSAGGTCRLLRCTDGWVAVNLARPEDVASLPAWLGDGVVSDAWSFVGARLRERSIDDVVARGRLLGLAVAPVERGCAAGAASAPGAPRGAAAWLQVSKVGEATGEARRAPPIVVDLSSLWAGPLCTHLLALAGARVIKVESTGRPDGARRGPPAFFDLLNAGKSSVALDFSRREGLGTLRALIGRADIVVESSRPRALAQLGIAAKQAIAARRGVVWVSITGYGRETPMGEWVAFGDDAAAAAGLVIDSSESAPLGGSVPSSEPGRRTRAERGDWAPVFCGDAIADPLTGMHAAAAALSTWQGGGGALLDVALERVAAYALSWPVAGPRAQVRAVAKGREPHEWEAVVDGVRCAVAPPRARSVTHRAVELGTDTRAVLAELKIPC